MKMYQTVFFIARLTSFILILLSLYRFIAFHIGVYDMEYLINDNTNHNVINGIRSQYLLEFGFNIIVGGFIYFTTPLLCDLFMWRKKDVCNISENSQIQRKRGKE